IKKIHLFLSSSKINCINYSYTFNRSIILIKLIFHIRLFFNFDYNKDTKMENLSWYDIEKKILPVIADRICDFAEINDIESTEKILSENKKLMLKVDGPYKYWQRLTPETVPIPLTDYCDLLTVLFLEKLLEKLKKCFVEIDKDELIKTLHEHSTLLNLLQFNRQAIDCCFNFHAIYDNIELQEIYFEEIDSIIGIIREYDPEYSLHLDTLKKFNDRKRISLTARFLIEKLCSELTDCLVKNDVDKALKILEDHEEIINEINMYDGAIKKYFEPIYQNACKHGDLIFADKFQSKIKQILNNSKQSKKFWRTMLNLLKLNRLSIFEEIDSIVGIQQWTKNYILKITTEVLDKIYFKKKFKDLNKILTY
ncbi:hypothetical protein BpHYR1_005493, partial [Brachionus plicatilis]